MKIESSDQTIGDLLNSAYYVIPRFQRPYSWEYENLMEFWDDIVKDSKDSYFIGSMVVYKISDRKFGVVDGQQRLTTITILLCVIRDYLLRHSLKDQAKGLHRLIERENINNEAEFVLQTETSYPYFQDHIQKMGSPDLFSEMHKEEENLKAASDIYSKQVGFLVKEILDHGKGSDSKKKSDIRNRLIEIRDSLLNLKTILIKLDDEDDAYLIFETLNTRGKDLALSDLVKNHFTKLLKPKNKALDQSKEKWSRVRETVEGSKIDISTDDFIHHYWLSKYEYLTAKNLFKEFRRHVTKSRASEELNSLLFDADLYRSIYEPDYGNFTDQEVEIRDALEAMTIFRVRQQIPCVLSLLRSYKKKILSKAQLERALVDIEKFHFHFTAITSQRSSGGISGMYALLGRRVHGSKTPQEAANVIHDLREKLRERIPGEDEFLALFPNLIYTNKISKQRALVRYVLLEIAKFEKAQFAITPSKLTIEHLAPQSQIGREGLTDEVVGQVGNLILVPGELNGKLRDKSFKDKEKILIDNGYSLDAEIANASAWGEAEIRARTARVAKQAYQKVWKI